MRCQLGIVGACLTLASSAGCSADAPNSAVGNSPSGAGGAQHTGGAATAGSGGAPIASGGGGVSTSGGSSAAGGADTVGEGGSRAGVGGKATSGGTAGTGVGTAGAAGAAGSSSGARPSAGCSKATARPAGGQVQVANTSLYLFPEGYDGSKPYPLLIALHACGNPNTEFVSLTNNTAFATDYVRAFPNTPDSGQCWSNYAGDVARVLAQYDELANDYCIDQSRVFATAHSSGAQLLVNVLSHKADAEHLGLRGIAPVAADPFNVAVPMPVLYIDGQMDTERGANSAKDTVARFRAANSCADTSKPYAAVMQCNSTESGHPAVTPGCNSYDGCSASTIWCSHNDPAYNGTEHGVPCFAMKAMLDFFAGL